MASDSEISVFSIGEVVTLRANPPVSGAVIKVLPVGEECRYEVFLNGKIGTYYASQLHKQAEANASNDILPFQEFQARLTALQMRQPSLSTLYSLNAARVNFIPYQFRPVLKFIRAERPRLLIADEVGVGKTIEAGLILRELQSRRDIQSVLILCPKPLVSGRKWADELKRFDEEFEALDGERLRYCLSETDLDEEWPSKYRKCIVPFSLFDEHLLEGDKDRGSSGTKGLFALDPAPRFDLVIVDEAHHLRNPNTFLHKGVKFFCENAEAILFLTATPIQLASNDLYVLLNLLHPDLILDRAGFDSMAEPNPHINAAVEATRGASHDWQQQAHQALLAAAATEWGQKVLCAEPEFDRLRMCLSGNPLSTQERIRSIRALENLHTFSKIINRTRRRDIGAFTTRKPKTVTVEFTLPQQELHDALLAAQECILRRTHHATSVKFLMTTLRRQAASCLYGLAPLIHQILRRRMDALEWAEADDDEADLNGESLRALEEEIQYVLSLAHNLDPQDPKWIALLTLLRDKQTLPNNKALLFSSFRHTLSYLMKHLQQENLRVGLVHGGVPEEERVQLRKRFSLAKGDPNALDILLSSEVGCEGLDYQFCDCLVNYDLPWNPMRVEQRIGRIDRYGQQSETVIIYNLVTPGTVDYDIYERCHLRIGIFRQALGGSEEILGNLTRELKKIAESLELTPEERQARLQQLADNEIRHLQEQAELEEQQAELFGIVLPRKQIEQEIRDAASAWLTPDALQNLIQRYLTATCGGDEHILGAKALKTLRLNEDARQQLLKDYQRVRSTRRASRPNREWEKWLKGAEPHLAITFDSDYACDNPGIAFIMPVHPLAQQAAWTEEDLPPFRTVCRVRDNRVPPGRYPFAIYQWEKRGIREDVELQPVSAKEIETETFLTLLENAEAAGIATEDFPEPEIFETLESRHYRLWSQSRQAHIEETCRLVQRRRESLAASHRARVLQLAQQRDANPDAKIRRMRESELRSVEADYARRLKEIEAAETQADIITQKVALGLMIVEEAQ